MHKETVPIKVWMYVFGVLAVMLLTLIVYTHYISSKKGHISNAFKTSLESNLKQFNQVNDSCLKVVIFGSSPSFFAIPNTRQLEQEIETKTGLKIRVLKINILWLSMEKLLNSNFLNDIINYPPDLLLIENNRLWIDDSWGDDILTPTNAYLALREGDIPKEYGEVVEELLIDVKTLFGWKQKIDTDCNPIIHQTFFLNEFDTLSYRILCEKINHVRKFDDNVTLNQCLIDLTNKGVKTYFFQAPLYSKYEKVYLTKEQRLEWHKIKNTYQDSLAIPCFIPAIHLNDSDYFDGGHLNYKGAQKFQPWLINLLDSLL